MCLLFVDLFTNILLRIQLPINFYFQNISAFYISLITEENMIEIFYVMTGQ